MDIYRDSMIGIQDKVAMMSIRKLMRSDLSDKEKLQEIVCVVHEYEYDMKKEKSDDNG